MTPAQKRKLNQKIQKALSAEVKSSWAGSLPPDERKDARAEALNARRALVEYIESLVKENI